MLQNIIIMTPRAQQQLVLAALLREHNPALSFTPAVTVEGLATIAPESLRRSRLIAFTSGTIVPPETLDALGHGAYNFHPGPPTYPGWAPAHFAWYERAKIFGATAHLMTERVDAGPIVGTETFIIPQGISVRELEQIAYVRLAYLFWRLARQLATQTEPLRTLPIEWGKGRSTRQMYESICNIPLNISKEELDRRIGAFHDDFRGIHPTVTLHGIKFRAVCEPVPKREEATAQPSPAIEDTRSNVRRRA